MQAWTLGGGGHIRNIMLLYRFYIASWWQSSTVGQIVWRSDGRLTDDGLARGFRAHGAWCMAGIMAHCGSWCVMLHRISTNPPVAGTKGRKGRKRSKGAPWVCCTLLLALVPRALPCPLPCHAVACRSCNLKIASIAYGNKVDEEVCVQVGIG